MKRLIALALGFSALPTTAHAEWINGNQLHEWCSSSNQYFASQCMGYILGSLDATPELKTPENATRGQVRDVIVKYLREHPEHRDMPAGMVIIMAAFEAWPSYQQSKK